MKELNINKAVVFRWTLFLFVFCIIGGLMQIIAPEFPRTAVSTGIMFFVLAAVFGAVTWKLSIAVRKERLAALNEQAKHEQEQLAD